jgi:cobalt-precorrin-5B (C1)-methyltransferase
MWIRHQGLNLYATLPTQAGRKPVGAIVFIYSLPFHNNFILQLYVDRLTNIPVANGVIGRNMKKTKLRNIPTTDTCAVAAAKGAALMLREQQILDEVEIILPASEIARFRLHGQKLVKGTASCYVIKDSGDDRDATNGVKIHVSIKVDFFTPRRIVLEGGLYTDQETKLGVAEPTEEEAINPEPKHMLLEVVKEVFAMRCIPTTLTVTVGKPEDGLEIAI